LLRGVRLSDLPTNPQVAVSPRPRFCKNTDHWIMSVGRSREEGVLATARILFMFRIIDWQEIELTKIFGAYRHAVAERRERLADVREGNTLDVDWKTFKLVTPELTPRGQHGVRVPPRERTERAYQYRVFDYEVLFHRDCEFKEAFARINAIILELHGSEHEILWRHSDAVTDVLNRGIYERDLSTALKNCTETGEQLSLVMSDVDHFHDLNDTYGHATGDVVLHEVASAIKTAVGKSGKVYRYGGEEFAVLLPAISTPAAAKIAEAMRQAVAKIACQGAHPKISCGVATYPEHGTGRRAFFKGADNALRKAKHTGRNRTCVAGEAMVVKAAAGF